MTQTISRPQQIPATVDIRDDERATVDTAELGDLLLGAFSEIELDVQDTVAEGDRVLVRLRFRRLGFIEYSGGPLNVNSALLSVVLHE